MSFEQDENLRTLSKLLPSDWKLEKFHDLSLRQLYLVIRGPPVLSLFENQINQEGRPLSSPQEQKDRENRLLDRLKTARRSESKLVYRIEPLWKEKQFEEAKKHNEKIQKQVSSFHKSIDDLTGPKKRISKGFTFFDDLSEEQKEKKAEIEKQIGSLRQKERKIPKFFSEKYSIFEEYKEHKGFSDSFTMTYPEDYPHHDSSRINIYEASNIVNDVLRKYV